MRYLSTLSLALVVHVLLSIGVLTALACTATPAIPANTPNIDATVEAAISATKTAEEGEPNLTIDMLEGVLEQFYLAHKNRETVFESGAACLMDGGFAMANRMGDFKKSFDPKRIGREWELQVTGTFCDGIEYFFINDATGKLSR